MTRIAVRGIACNESKLLCVKLKPYNDLVAAGSDWWCLPGGTVDEGEQIQDALVREMHEETGVHPTVGKLMYVHQFKSKNADHLEFFFHITNGTDYLSVRLENTSHGGKEIEKIDFVIPSKTVILPKFLTEVDFTHQLEAELPVRFIHS